MHAWWPNDQKKNSLPCMKRVPFLWIHYLQGRSQWNLSLYRLSVGISWTFHNFIYFSVYFLSHLRLTSSTTIFTLRYRACQKQREVKLGKEVYSVIRSFFLSESNWRFFIIYLFSFLNQKYFNWCFFVGELGLMVQSLVSLRFFFSNLHF